MPPPTLSRTTTPVRFSTTDSFAVPPTQFPHLQAIQPIDASNPSTSTPDAVLLDLHTTIVIPDYSLYYHAPIQSFRPTYHALADGSLVATPFIADMRNANIHLACISAVAMFFFVSTLTTAQYIRRGKIKKKGLFWLLLLSQLLGFIAMISMIVPFFDQFVGCKATAMVVIICSGLSFTLLMTGILGTKAYRCLDNSKYVLIGLAVIRTTTIALIILDLTKVTAVRRISGSCLPMLGGGMMAGVIVAQTVESAFISGCFLLAVWKASRTDVQGRMSIQVSLKDAREPKEVKISVLDKIPPNDMDHGQRRGWWDYVPDPSEVHIHPLDTPNPKSNSGHSGAGYRLNMWSYPPSDAHGAMSHRKMSMAINRAPSIAFSAQHQTPYHDRLGAHDRAHSPPPPSVMSRLSKYMPRMQLFREVLRNELAYTTFLTVFYLIIGLLMILGVSRRLLMDPTGWIALSWLTVSGFTVQSFGRVVRRHEREAILQHPSAWDPVYRAELEASRAFARGRSRRAYSPVSVVSRAPRRPRTAADPFDDLPRRPSRDSPSRAEPPLPSMEFPQRTLSPTERMRPWLTERRPSASSTSSYEPSATNVQLHPDPLYSNVPWDSAVVLPSPVSGNYPSTVSMSSGRSDSPRSDNRKLVRQTSFGAETSLRASSRQPSTSSLTRSHWDPSDPHTDYSVREERR